MSELPAQNKPAPRLWLWLLAPPVLFVIGVLVLLLVTESSTIAPFIYAAH